MNDSGKQPMSAEEFYSQVGDSPDICSSSWFTFCIKFAEAYASYREQANAERMQWYLQHMTDLRNAIYATIPEPPALDETGHLYPLGDDALVAWPAKLLKRAELAESRCKELREALQAMVDVPDVAGWPETEHAKTLLDKGKP